MKNNNILTFIGLLLIALCVLFSVSQISIVYVGNEVLSANITSPTNEDGLEVSIQDYTGEIQSYFLTYNTQTTTLTSDTMINSKYINVLNNTNCNINNAVNVYNGRSFYQGLITAINTTSITLTPPIDKSFMEADSIVECGITNMAYDGSVTPRIYNINLPYNASWDITSSVIGILDNTPMDSSTFGGIPALTNGFVIRQVDGTSKNLLLTYNNNGFNLRGYNVEYIDRAPSGTYGLNAIINVKDTYGAVFRIEGTKNQTMQVLIQDDLSDLTRLVMTINGHLVTE